MNKRYNSHRESRIENQGEKKGEDMGKSLWKIYQVRENLFIAVIPSSNSKWKIEWHLDYEGNYSNYYYDDGIKDHVYLSAFKQFETANAAAQYINDVEKRKSFFVKDVTDEYFIR
jgi:hypothetical protein